MPITYHTNDQPADDTWIAELQSLTLAQPVDAAAVRAAVLALPPGSLRHRVVAVDKDVVGYGEVYRYANTRAGKWYMQVVVDPTARDHGIGTQLLQMLETWSATYGATLLVGEVSDADRTSLAFVAHRGYVERRHSYDSLLDLRAWSLEPFATVLPAVQVQGIRFFTLADAPGPATEQQVYELLSRTMADLPGYEATEFMSFETWRGWMVERAVARSEGVILAADGDRLVGITTLEQHPDHAYTPHTSVDRAYRGRHIALALKLLGIQQAQRWGATQLWTGNDAANGSMLRINQRLGFVPTAGSYEVAKAIEPEQGRLT